MRDGKSKDKEALEEQAKIPDDSTREVAGACKQLAFFIAASNEDILKRVDKLLAAKGLLGLTDMNGRIHYLVDGRRGAQYASQRIEDFSRSILREDNYSKKVRMYKLEKFVDSVLNCYYFDRKLRGFIFLRHMLIVLTEDQSLRSPISKTLYPVTALAYRISPTKVERNVRYCLEQLCLKEAEMRKQAQQKPAFFCEETAAYGRNVVRELIIGRSSYANCEAIAILNDRIQELIRLEEKDKEYDNQPSLFDDEGRP